MPADTSNTPNSTSHGYAVVTEAYYKNTTCQGEILNLSHFTLVIYSLSIWNGSERKMVRIAL